MVCNCTPRLFKLQGLGVLTVLGVPPFRSFPPPPPATSYSISGVTKDSTGAILGGCTLNLYRTADNIVVATQVSDGSGNYSFTQVSSGMNYYIVAYKAGSPDVAGTTVNTLVGT